MNRTTSTACASLFAAVFALSAPLAGSAGYPGSAPGMNGAIAPALPRRPAAAHAITAASEPDARQTPSARR